MQNLKYLGQKTKILIQKLLSELKLNIPFNILRSKPCFILRESLTVFLLAILNSKNCPSNIWNDSSGSINFILWNTSCLNMEYRIFSIIRLGLFSTQAIFGRAYFWVMLIFETFWTKQRLYFWRYFLSQRGQNWTLCIWSSQ